MCVEMLKEHFQNDYEVSKVLQIKFQFPISFFPHQLSTFEQGATTMVITMASYALQTPPLVSPAKPPGPKSHDIRIKKSEKGKWAQKIDLWLVKSQKITKKP